MANIHFVTGAKGNVGKTAFSAALIQHLMVKGKKVIAIDADQLKQSLSETNPDAKQLAISEDPMLEDQPDAIWELAQDPNSEVVVDLAAQADPIIQLWLDERGVYDAAKQVGIEIYHWWVADLDRHSFAELEKTCADSLGHYVLVRSLFRANETLWDTNKTWQTTVDRLGEKVRVIDFPKVRGQLLDKLRQKRLSYQAAVTDLEFKQIDRLDASSLNRWLMKCFAEIDKAYNVVVPEPSKSEKKEQKSEKT